MKNRFIAIQPGDSKCYVSITNDIKTTDLFTTDLLEIELWTTDLFTIHWTLNKNIEKNDLWQLIFDHWSNSKISSTLLNLWQRIIFTIELLYNYWTLDNDPLDNCSIGQIINWTTDPLESASAIQKFQKITCWTFNSQKDQLSFFKSYLCLLKA